MGRAVKLLPPALPRVIPVLCLQPFSRPLFEPVSASSSEQLPPWGRVLASLAPRLSALAFGLPVSRPPSEPQLAASPAWLPVLPLELALVPQALPLFSEVPSAPTGHASCSRPSSAESPSSLLWLDA
jgi:hypothetical protein